MALPPLLDPADPAILADFPGAPFAPQVVAAAAESVRSDAGWHIAPVVSETVLCDGSGWRPLLLLPTLRVVSVQEVRAYVGGLWVVLTGWRHAGSGMLYHPNGWPYGAAGVEVDLTHGYAAAPDDLLPVVAARCQRALVDASITQRSETAGGRTSSESYNINRLQLEAGSSGLGRYKLPGRVA